MVGGVTLAIDSHTSGEFGWLQVIGVSVGCLTGLGLKAWDVLQKVYLLIQSFGLYFTKRCLKVRLVERGKVHLAFKALDGCVSCLICEQCILTKA